MDKNTYFLDSAVHEVHILCIFKYNNIWNICSKNYA